MKQKGELKVFARGVESVVLEIKRLSKRQYNWRLQL